jgi:predicted phage-related endonuclease
MDVQIFDCEQGSTEWYACRLGIPTASEFDTVLAKGKGGGESKTRRTYMLKLAGEILTGEPMYNYQSEHMERGKEMEAEARDLYAMVTDNDVKPVGFMRRGDAGASPDSLIGDDGLLEIKTKLAHLQLDCILSGEVPSEHYAQCQGQLWISGRQWVDFVSYWPGLPLFVKRLRRDEMYIAKLREGVDLFNNELRAIVESVKGYKRQAA